MKQSHESAACSCCHEELEMNLELLSEPGARPVIPKYINVRFVHTKSGEIQARRYILELANG